MSIGFAALDPAALEYLAKHPRVLYAACREVPDLFIWHVFGHPPSKMHVELQRYMDRPGPVKRIFLPRNHAKTTQLTIGRFAWEVGRNPNVRIQVVQSSKPEAGKTVGAIKSVLESERFQQVFPEIKPHPEEWGKLALSVKRTKVGLRDPTVSAQPIFGSAGSRADKLAFDDVENLDNSIRQPAMREAVKAAYVNTWLPVLEPDGQEWDIGTPWHVDGQTMDWMRDSLAGGPEMFFRACKDGRSPWTEKFPPDVLATMRRKMGEIAYARAYELRPLSGDETVFKEADLLAAARPLPGKGKLRSPVRWARIDLAFSEETQGLKGRGKTDPDYSVMGVADLDGDGHCWMVEVMRRRCSFPDWKLRALAMAERLGVARVKIETNGPQKGLGQELQQMFGASGISCRVDTLGNQDKYSRAAAQQAVVEQHRFHLRTLDDGELMPDMRVMRDELSQFPLGAHDDTVDVAVGLMAEAKGSGEPGRDAQRERNDPLLMASVERDLDAMEEETNLGPVAYARHHELEFGDEDD